MKNYYNSALKYPLENTNKSKPHPKGSVYSKIEIFTFNSGSGTPMQALSKKKLDAW